MEVDVPPPPRGRKRAASSPPLDEEPDVDNAAERIATRTRVTSELDNLELIPKDEAWELELEKVLGFNRGSNSSTGPVLLCIIGNMSVQVELSK